MSLEALQLGLTPSEIATVRRGLGREPNEIEWSIIDAEWSEHSSYKSSKALLRLFPTKGKRVVLGPGYDAGVVDVGDGYVVTLHIESHNHPSAVDPYGGASTGIGGVLRDILSMGTQAHRPGGHAPVRKDRQERATRDGSSGTSSEASPTTATAPGSRPWRAISSSTRASRGTASSTWRASGVGRKDDLILGEAKTPGDVLVLIGGSTGRDGIKGATFASKNLSDDAEEDRSSVQVPDPFMKKLLLDSLLEAVEHEDDQRDEGPGGRGPLDGALRGRVQRWDGRGRRAQQGELPRGRHVAHGDNDIRVTGEDAPGPLARILGAEYSRSSASTRSRSQS